MIFVTTWSLFSYSVTFGGHDDNRPAHATMLLKDYTVTGIY